MRSSGLLLFLGIVGLAGFFFGLQPARAEDNGITAREVLDRETLKAFVQSAKAHLETLTDSSQIDVFLEQQWKFGSVYV